MLTVLGVVSNLTDRRVALMIQIETLPRPSPRPGADAALATRGAAPESVATVGRFGDVRRAARGRSSPASSRALATFSASTRDFTEFNAHLKDNVQRMSLSFGDLSDTLKSQVVALKHGNGR